MKKQLIISSALTLIALMGFSQDQQRTTDTTTFNIGKSTVVIYDTEENSIDTNEVKVCEDNGDNELSFVMDIGMNGYTAANGSITLPAEQSVMDLNYARSRSVGFSFMYTKGNLIGDRLYISPGIGLNWNNYFFKNNISIAASNDSTTFNIDSVITYDKYKLRATYIQVPIVIGARIGNLDKPLGLQIGVVGSYRISSILKQKFIFEDAKHRSKIKDDFNISPFKLDAIARVSVGDVCIFARYSLTTLFEKDKAPELYPISVGFTFGGF